MHTEVSIIIPAKNNQVQLNYCLKSILNSKKNFEFLIDDVISWIKLNPVKWNEIPTKNTLIGGIVILLIIFIHSLFMIKIESRNYEIK